ELPRTTPFTFRQLVTLTNHNLTRAVDTTYARAAISDRPARSPEGSTVDIRLATNFVRAVAAAARSSRCTQPSFGDALVAAPQGSLAIRGTDLVATFIGSRTGFTVRRTRVFSTDAIRTGSATTLAAVRTFSASKLAQ